MKKLMGLDFLFLLVVVTPLTIMGQVGIGTVNIPKKQTV